MSPCTTSPSPNSRTWGADALNTTPAIPFAYHDPGRTKMTFIRTDQILPITDLIRQKPTDFLAMEEGPNDMILLDRALTALPLNYKAVIDGKRIVREEL